jgi:hypothetical protein
VELHEDDIDEDIKKAKPPVKDEQDMKPEVSKDPKPEEQKPMDRADAIAAEPLPQDNADFSMSDFVDETKFASEDQDGEA